MVYGLPMLTISKALIQPYSRVVTIVEIEGSLRKKNVLDPLNKITTAVSYEGTVQIALCTENHNF